MADVDLGHRTIRVNKAWKRSGEDDATDTPGWLAKQLKAKHTMRDHQLGSPKTQKSRRAITISPSVAKVLAGRIGGKPAAAPLQARLGHESITTTIDT